MTLATLPADLPFFLTDFPPEEAGCLLTLRHGVTRGRAYDLLHEITGAPADVVRHALDACPTWRGSPEPLTTNDIRALEAIGRLIPWSHH